MKQSRFSVELPAGRIPDRTRVRKPGGSRTYLLRHGLRLYDEDGNKVAEITGAKCMASENGVSVVADDRQLAVDFDSARGLAEFVAVLVAAELDPRDADDEDDDSDGADQC